jgi:spore maturation protein CgeB
MSLLIVGSDAYTGVGGSLLRGAEKEGIAAYLADSAAAYETHKIVRRVWWHLLGRRPFHLRGFSENLVKEARERGVTAVIATGIAPVNAAALKALRALGIKTANFLTDDPWNRAHRAAWFLEALPLYDVIFTPRRANAEELLAAGCARVHYLPFAYDEKFFFVEREAGAAAKEPESDVYFAGGADPDRIPYMSALIRAGLDLRLYGAYWSRYEETRAHDGGVAYPDAIRRALNSTRIGLCLVRRSNRDGNCMRTFEVPAAGACLLAEDTAEHREIFGPSGEAAIFFSSVEDMVEKARRLVGDREYCRRIAAAGHALVTEGKHTYRDRLVEMLAVMESR